DSRKTMADEVMEVLSSIPASLGRFIVRGNHDLAVIGNGALRNASSFGHELLENRGVTVQFGGESFHLAGVDFGRPDMDRALADRGDDPVLFLTHTPDMVVRFRTELDHLWFAAAGHLHGGQIRFPVVGALLKPTQYPEIFDQGWARGIRERVYVSRGTGVVVLPLRLLCRPEVTIFHIV